MIKNIAHRGYSAQYPENSMLAFSKALEAGCDGIELDVHLSGDGIPVIIHDERVDGTSDGSGAVKDMTLTQLKTLRLSKGERIPTLEEYFDLVKTASVFTNIELKNSVFRYEGMEQKVIRLIRSYGLEDRVLFSSFNHFSILECKREIPAVPCGFLTWSWLIDAGEYTRRNGVECYHPEFHSLTGAGLKELHEHGVLVHPYTVNERSDLEMMITMGVDGIITNDPKLLGRLLAEW